MPLRVVQFRLHFMRRSPLVLLVLVPLMLAACAPSAQPNVQADQGDVGRLPILRAAFSAEGVAWTSGGVACVARGPSFQAQCPALPPVTDVAWNGSDAWGAVPSLGLVVTLDRSARSVAVGRVVALSSTRVYREDGSAVTYSGAGAGGVIGGPSAALTGTDGQDYVLLSGQVRRVSDGAVLPANPVVSPGSTGLSTGLSTGSTPQFLTATPQGVQVTDVPQVYSGFGSYRLSQDRLERLDDVGRVLASVPHGPGRVGLVGQEVVTVSPQGQVRVFGLNLQPRL